MYSLYDTLLLCVQCLHHCTSGPFRLRKQEVANYVKNVIHLSFNHWRFQDVSLLSLEESFLMLYAAISVHIFVVQQCLSLQNQHYFGGPLSLDTRAAYISISRSALNNFCARKKPSATRGSTWPWWEAMWQLSSGDTYRWWFQLLFIYRPSCGTNISPTSRHFLSR